MIFTNPVDVTTQRSFNTVYQNKTGRPIFVSVTCNPTATLNHTATIQARIGLTATPDINISQTGPFNTTSPVASLNQLTFIVPSMFFYQVVTAVDGGSTIGLGFWIEYL